MFGPNRLVAVMTTSLIVEAKGEVIFERVGEVKAAQLTQMILNSKTAAIEPLEKEIEKPVITTPGEA